MNIFRENDVIRLREEVEASIITGDEIFVPKGTIGTIVLVHGNPDQPSAYEIEFFIPGQNDFALATVDVTCVSKV
ncbi:hypothetical protein BVK86_02305 [Pseudomonas reinekei]|uniref:DUF4926 domain-containing protein n=1 Tax=Pseudomonas reinekei TaxID=395598 RepID=A0A1Q9X5F2_PSERE|nr:DUF4926 domain-containing protein [Pseudomonas reinekei]OLU06213.1 hypothetical protein BVK86_02305 [Pseudomonas reinekei]